jgi:hypothetical protein
MGNERFKGEDFTTDLEATQATLDKIYNPPTGKEDTGPKPVWKQEALDEIQAEMDRIHTGASDLTRYAIQDAGLIVLKGFARLTESFTDRNVNEFLMLAGQDYSFQAREHFEKLLKGETDDGN